MNNDSHDCSTEPNIYSLTEIDSRNKLSEKAVSRNELATIISNMVKSLQVRLRKFSFNHKQKQLNEEFFSEFSLTERMFLQKFTFSESDISDRGVKRLKRVLVESNDLFSKFTSDFGKNKHEFHVKMGKKRTMEATTF